MHVRSVVRTCIPRGPPFPAHRQSHPRMSGTCSYREGQYISASFQCSQGYKKKVSLDIINIVMGVFTLARSMDRRGTSFRMTVLSRRASTRVLNVSLNTQGGSGQGF